MSELRRRNVFRVAIAYVIIAWLILQVGDTLAPALQLADWVNTALAFFLILGFPLAVFFAWAYELTPEGIKPEKHVDRSKSITYITGRKLDYLIIASLALTLVIFAFDKWVLEPTRDAKLVEVTTQAVREEVTGGVEDGLATNGIAVMAFADLSSEGDQEYFSDGISEEILNALAHISELHVISRSSAFSFKGKGLDIPTIAEQLGVASILEGSVRKSGNKVRITAQLIDARTDAHVWSATYDRDLVDIFAVQDEIAAAIVGALRQQLGLRIATMPRAITTVNVEAHEAYLRGRHLQLQRSTDAIERAAREFEKAISLDPDYALAHAELVITILLLQRGHYGDLTMTEAIARAAPHAEQAMLLDPALAEAHAAAGFLISDQQELQEALAHYEKAVEINPNYAIVYTWMGSIDSALGRYSDALAMTEMTLRLDPLSEPANWNYLMALISRGRMDDVDRHLEKLITVWPSMEPLLRGLRLSLGGKWADYVIGRLEFLPTNPTNVVTRRRLGGLFATLGLEKEALDIYGPPMPLVLRWLGKPEHALEIAQARVDEDPMSNQVRRALGLALASFGDCTRAQPILEEIWQLSDGRVTYPATGANLFRISEAVALVNCRRAAKENADDIVAAISDNVRRYREAGMTSVNSVPHQNSVDYEEGLVAFLTGEREKGLELIAKAVEDGFFIAPNEAFMRELYDDPGFAPIRAIQEARQERERNRFLAIVCDGNPYEAVWQPAEGTCERFAAASEN